MALFGLLMNCFIAIKIQFLILQSGRQLRHWESGKKEIREWYSFT